MRTPKGYGYTAPKICSKCGQFHSSLTYITINGYRYAVCQMCKKQMNIAMGKQPVQQKHRKRTKSYR